MLVAMQKISCKIMVDMPFFRTTETAFVTEPKIFNCL